MLRWFVLLSVLVAPTTASAQQPVLTIREQQVLKSFFGTSGFVEQLMLKETSTHPLSDPGFARIMVDAASHTIICSFNGSAYVSCLGGGGGSFSLNGLFGAVSLVGTPNEIGIVSGGGVITVSTAQPISTVSSPSFVGLTLSGIVGTQCLRSVAGVIGGAGFDCTTGGSVPAGVTGSVQINTAGAFAADANLLWIGTPKRLVAPIADKGGDTSSVTAYGAVGNGIADDTAAFVAAIANGGVVTVPSGTFLLPNGLTIGINVVAFHGSVAGNTVLKVTNPAANGITLTGGQFYIELSNFQLFGPGSGTGRGISAGLASPTRVISRNVMIRSFGSHGLFANNGLLWRIEHNRSELNGGDGFHLQSSGGGFTNGCWVVDSEADGNAGDGLLMDTTYYCGVQNFVAQTNTGAGIRLISAVSPGTQGNTIITPHTEGNALAIVLGANTERNTVIGGALSEASSDAGVSNSWLREDVVRMTLQPRMCIGCGAINPVARLDLGGSNPDLSFTDQALGGNQYLWRTAAAVAGDFELVNATANKSLLYFSPSTGFVGLGSLAPPRSPLPQAGVDIRNATIISTNLAALPSFPGVLQVAAANGTQTGIVADSFANQSAYICRRANGTPTARSTVLASEPICSIVALGAYDGTSYSSTIGSFTVFAKENFTSTAQGTFSTIGIVRPGTTALIEAMRFDGKQGVGLATIDPIVISGSRNLLGTVQIPPLSFGTLAEPGPTEYTYVTGFGIVDNDTTTYTGCVDPNAGGANPTCLNKGAGSATFNLLKNMGVGFTGIGIGFNIATYDIRTGAAGTVEDDQVNIWSTMVNNSGRTVNAINMYPISVRPTTANSITGVQAEMVNFAASDASSHAFIAKPGEEANRTTTEGAMGDAFRVLGKNVRSLGSPVCGVAGITCFAGVVEGWVNAYNLVALDQVTSRFRVASSTGETIINTPSGFVGNAFHVRNNSGADGFTISYQGDVAALTATLTNLVGGGTALGVCTTTTGTLYAATAIVVAGTGGNIDGVTLFRCF